MANRNIYKKETAHFTLKLMQTNSNIRETTSVNEFSLFVIGYVVLFVTSFRPPARHLRSLSGIFPKIDFLYFLLFAFSFY